MSKVEFPVRVALPADEKGVRYDLAGSCVVSMPDDGDGYVTVYVRDTEAQTTRAASVHPRDVPWQLDALGILDITERGKAGAWDDHFMPDWEGRPCSHDDSSISAAPDGSWHVVYMTRTLAHGQAPGLDEAKAQADHYAAMLYELEGGAFVVPSSIPEQPVPAGDVARLPPSVQAGVLLRDAFRLMGPDDTWADGIDANAADAWWGRVRDWMHRGGAGHPDGPCVESVAPEAPALPLAGVVFEERWRESSPSRHGGWALESVCGRVKLGLEFDPTNGERGCLWGGITLDGGPATQPANHTALSLLALARELGATVRGGS